MRVLNALLLGAQLGTNAAPGFALAANRSVTVGADTAANRPSFFKSVRRCFAVLDFAAVACVLSFLPVLAMWSPRWAIWVEATLRLDRRLGNKGTAVANPLIRKRAP